MRGDDLHLAVDVPVGFVRPVELVLAHAKREVVGRDTASGVDIAIPSQPHR